MKKKHLQGIESDANEKSIDMLRKFFNLTFAVFEMQHNQLCGVRGDKSPMHIFLGIGKKELEKEHPDLKKIHMVIEIMGDYAEEIGVEPIRTNFKKPDERD